MLHLQPGDMPESLKRQSPCAAADSITAVSFSRRGFLSRGGAALGVISSPAAIAVAAPAMAAVPTLAAFVDQARTTENPELLAIGAESRPAMKRFEGAEVALDKARERALTMAPPIPDGLPVPFGISIFGQIGWCALPEPSNILGDPIELPKAISAKSGRELHVRVPRAQDVLKDRRMAGRLTGMPSWHKGEHRRL